MRCAQCGNTIYQTFAPFAHFRVEWEGETEQRGKMIPKMRHAELCSLECVGKWAQSRPAVAVRSEVTV